MTLLASSAVIVLVATSGIINAVAIRNLTKANKSAGRAIMALSARLDRLESRVDLHMNQVHRIPDAGGNR